MHENPYGTSLEARVLCATPLELVALLYDGAIEAVQAARRHLAEGNVTQRSRSTTKAVKILSELFQSLKREPGDELSARLAGLYDYMQRSLLDANFRQVDSGFAETEKLLKTLREAWAELCAQSPKPVAPQQNSNPYTGSSQPREGVQYTA